MTRTYSRQDISPDSSDDGGEDEDEVRGREEIER
jgi:hypothetical protein